MERITVSLILLLAGGAAAPVAAQQSSSGWTLNGKEAPADPSQKKQNGFATMMLVTGDYQAFLNAWAGPSPPNLPVTDTVTRDKPVNGMLLFANCRAGADGNCNVTAKLAIIAPDGTPYGDVMDGRVWNRPPMPKNQLQLAESGIGFALDPDDPTGTYTLKATVTDQVAGITLRLEKSVTAMEQSR